MLLLLFLDVVVDFLGVINRICRVMEANDAGDGGVGGSLSFHRQIGGKGLPGWSADVPALQLRRLQG